LVSLFYIHVHNSSTLTTRAVTGKPVAIIFRNIEGLVKPDQIIIGPITTPDCPDPAEIPRYIRDDYGFYGFDTVFLEDATWNALCEIARARGCTVDELCCDIDLNFAPGEPFEQAARFLRVALSRRANFRQHRAASRASYSQGAGGPPALSMTEKATTSPAIDAEPAESFGKLKSAMDVQVASIKRDLAQWLDQRRGPRDSTATIIALMETTCDHYLAARTHTASDLAPAAADASDMIQAVLRRAVQRRPVTLYMNSSGQTRARNVPINDEEWANRLTEMLKLLDALATRLPNDGASRQLLDDAAGPLGTLLTILSRERSAAS
jgi:predicted DNA-binding ribbon-helix-helix protein